MGTVVVYVDATFHPDTCLAACGIVIQAKGRTSITGQPCGKVATSGLAEASGLLRALKKAHSSHPVDRLVIRNDCQGIVNLVNRCLSNPQALSEIKKSVRAIIRQIFQVAQTCQVVFEWVSRKLNKAADKMARQCLKKQAAKPGQSNTKSASCKKKAKRTGLRQAGQARA